MNLADLDKEVEDSVCHDNQTSGDTLSSKSNSSSNSIVNQIGNQIGSTNNLGWIKHTLRFVVDQWFVIGLGLVIAIASQVQVPQSRQKLKSTVVSYTAVSIIFFFTGCTLKTRILLENYSRWKLHIFVQVQCYLMTSAIIFGVVSLCATKPSFMDPGLLLGFILTGSTATTISSNVVMTGEAHGNQALTVVQSTIGNFLGPFLTPLLFKAYVSSGAYYTRVLPLDNGGYAELYRRVFKMLGLTIFVPMVVGQIVQNVIPEVTKKVCITWKVAKISSLCLLVIIWQTYDQAFATNAFASVKGSNMVFTVFISVALYLLFLGVAFFTSVIWLPRVDIISILYLVPAKSPATGIPISSVLFVGISPLLEAKIQIPMVIYQGLQILAGSILITPLRKWVDQGKAEECHIESTV